MPVTHITTFTAKANMVVSYECENCESTNRYIAREISNGVQIQTDIHSLSEGKKLELHAKARQALESEKAKAINSKIYGFQKCPSCGYTQSWMKISNYQFIAVTFFALLCPAVSMLFYFGDPKSGMSPLIPIGLTLLGIIVIIINVRTRSVNKKFGNVERINKPRITFEDH